ncbi:hypothetical protein K469DRAFT_360731 [Zopfia rhizophila CBS 207.26]|uniref:Uncharacterized protein n=1 Tax=Zopfia rhizophila CBS 207.26 TaxID=1314779 RepID=A0A6A6EHR1_9PEZI|nr:hypothetical protein K469DRAFT_360731 [Zopfia rhizophila CBS 207.26]
MGLSSNGSSNSLENESKSRKLPPFDRALNTRKLCLIGLSLSYVLSVAITIYGIVAYVFADKRVRKAYKGYPRASWDPETFAPM